MNSPDFINCRCGGKSCSYTYTMCSTDTFSSVHRRPAEKRTRLLFTKTRCRMPHTIFQLNSHVYTQRRIHGYRDTRMRRYTDTSPGDTDSCSPASPVMQSCIQSLRRHLDEESADRRAGSDCPKSFQVNNKWSIIIRHQTRRANIEYPFALFAFVFAFVFVPGLVCCLHCHWFIFFGMGFSICCNPSIGAFIMTCNELPLMPLLRLLVRHESIKIRAGH